MKEIVNPTEVANYGKEMFEKGFEKGYKQAILDSRKRRSLRSKSIRKRFDKFYDELDDLIATKKRK